MKRALGWTLAVIVLLGAAAFGGRWYATKVMDDRAVTPKLIGAATPASDSMAFARLAISSGDRTLIGWWVRAPGDSATPALLFLHGNRSSISDYVPLQRFFHRQGVSTMVFDYTGFGASGGRAALSKSVEDAAVVARVFAESAGPVRRTVFGSALGATVLLQAIDSIQPHVHGAVIEGVTASVREAAVRDGRIPKFLAPMVVDIADNVQAARRVRIPLLAVHSVADGRFPLADAERVLEAVSARSALVKHPRPGHSALLTSSRPCDWARILRFVKGGELPAERVDTANLCAVAPPADTLSRR
jgi:pimeloyl-ACP methyl ester carboxylesterase